jgi:hypothetical protein
MFDGSNLPSFAEIVYFRYRWLIVSLKTSGVSLFASFSADQKKNGVEY